MEARVDNIDGKCKAADKEMYYGQEAKTKDCGIFKQKIDKINNDAK